MKLIFRAGANERKGAYTITPFTKQSVFSPRGESCTLLHAELSCQILFEEKGQYFFSLSLGHEVILSRVSILRGRKGGDFEKGFDSCPRPQASNKRFPLRARLTPAQLLFDPFFQFLFLL